MGFSGGTQHLQDYQLSVSSDGRLFVHKPESPHTDNPNPETAHYLNLDYELHQGTKLDYLFLESSRMLEGSKVQEPMRTREDPDIDFFDVLDGKPTSCRLFANWDSLYVP